MASNLNSAEGIDAASDTVRIMREELAAISRRAYNQGLVVGISGNNSVRVPGTDAVLIKVTGVCQGDMDTADSVLVDLDGNVLEEGQAALQGGSLAPGHLPEQPARERYRARPPALRGRVGRRQPCTPTGPHGGPRASSERSGWSTSPPRAPRSWRT